MYVAAGAGGGLVTERDAPTKRVIILLVSLVLASCVYVVKEKLAEPDLIRGSLPEPDLKSGSIGVTVRRGRWLGGGKGTIVQIFFVRLEDGNEAFSATDLIPSNYTPRNQIYLLNADPGRYAMVAALMREEDEAVGLGTVYGETFGVSFENDRWVFFSMAMISESEVTVVPQEMVFMGDYVVRVSATRKKADAAQAHYHRLLMPGQVGKPSQVGKMASILLGLGSSFYTADMKKVAKDKETERNFWTKARIDRFDIVCHKFVSGWHGQVLLPVWMGQGCPRAEQRGLECAQHARTLSLALGFDGGAQGLDCPLAYLAQLVGGGRAKLGKL